METLSAPEHSAKLEIQLGQVALVSSPELGWCRDESTRHFDICLMDAEGPEIGNITVNYDYRRRTAQPHSLLETLFQGRGIGTEIYTALPFVPLPCGTDFRAANFRLRTRGHSNAANGLWESLRRNGLARKLEGNRQYELLAGIPAPQTLEVRELGMLRTLDVAPSEDHLERASN